MISVMKAGSDWRQIGLFNLLLVASLTRGEIYERQQMERIEEYRSKDVERCVKPLNSEAMLKVFLVVKSTAINVEYVVGFSLIDQDFLAPLGSWHKLSINHIIADFRHNLKVKLDNKKVDFSYYKKNQWFSTSYSYEKIHLFAKGKVEVVDCNVLATTAGKPTTTRLPTPPPSTAAPTVPPTTAAPPPPPPTSAPPPPTTTAAPPPPSPTAAPPPPSPTAAPLPPSPTAAPPPPPTVASLPAVSPEPYHPSTNKDKVTTAGVGGSIPEQPMHQPPTPTTELARPPAPTKEDAESSWVWSMGGVGGVPVVPLTIVAVVVLAVSITLCVICWRKKSQAKQETAKAAQLENFRHTDYQVVDTRDEMEGNKEGPSKDEGVVRDARINQRMDDSYEPIMNQGRPLTTFSNSGIENHQH